MSIDETNRAQAEFWTVAGTNWTAARDRFDAQVNEHGLVAMESLAPAAGETVIDIGCGAGTSTVQLAQHVGPSGRVHGLDISPTMIAGATAYAAEHGVANVTFAVGDAMAEAFRPEADALYSRFGVMFFSDAAAAFANMLTALRPGGRLGFVCWQSPQANPWVSTPLRVVREFIDIPFGGDPTAPGPFSLGDPDRIRAVLADSGFVNVNVAPRLAHATMGVDRNDAIDFMSKLLPPFAALEASDPQKGAELRARLMTELADWEGPDGVKAPSAVWIVTASRAA